MEMKYGPTPMAATLPLRFDCGYPVVADASENQRGSDEDCPAACRGCGVKYFLDLRLDSRKLYIHIV